MIAVHQDEVHDHAARLEFPQHLGESSARVSTVEGDVGERGLVDTRGEVERVDLTAPLSDSGQAAAAGGPELDGDPRAQARQYTLDGGLFAERHLRGLLKECV